MNSRNVHTDNAETIQAERPAPGRTTSRDSLEKNTYLSLCQPRPVGRKLPDSVHCKGFESRIRDLRQKLAS